MSKVKTFSILIRFIPFILLSACGSDSDNSEIFNTAESTIISEESTNETEDLDLGFVLVDTNQGFCSDNDGNVITCPDVSSDYFGQDAQFNNETPNFTLNNDGTVSDNVTGLMWQQVPEANGLSYDEALNYAENLSLGSYTDWRIPTTKELFSISDFSQGWPYLNENYFSLAISTSVSKDEQYWTERYVGTTSEGGNDAAFGVNHATGHIKAYPAGVTGPMGKYVRAVRGGNYGENEFEDNLDATVSDLATGLMWAKSDSGYGMTWDQALVYAKSSTLAGYDDWRLPNIKELQSIVDYSKSPSAYLEENLGPAINTDFFNITALSPSDTAYDIDYGYFWSSTSAYFGGDSLEHYYAWYVAFGTAPDDEGNDTHGAGGMRFDTKYEGGPLGEGGERFYNYVRLVRDID